MTRQILFSAVLILAGLGAAAQTDDPAALPSLETLAREIDLAWDADVASWSNYAFRRHVIRKSYDTHDEVTSHNEMEFRVTPSVHGFDELLIRFDSRRPTSKEVKEHRKAGRFAKHYSQASELELDNPLGFGLSRH